MLFQNFDVFKTDNVNVISFGAKIVVKWYIMNNNWIWFGDIRNNQGRGKCNQPMPEAEADYTY